jgi:hypothetical protein
MGDPIKTKEREAWQENAYRIVKALFESDKRIRYCAIIGEKGEEIVGGMRPGIKSLEPELESSRLKIQSLIGMGMNRNWNSLLGDSDYIIAHRSKVVLFIFPLSGNSLLVSAEPDYPLEKFRRIADIVSSIPEEFR